MGARGLSLRNWSRSLGGPGECERETPKPLAAVHTELGVEMQISLGELERQLWPRSPISVYPVLSSSKINLPDISSSK